MKKLFCAAAAAAMLLIPSLVYADTVINVPIDSRPISCEYFENLAELGGDEVITVDKADLDYFSAALSDSYFGNSVKVRQELSDIVSKNNKKSTVVIINSSSYITNGLVGSRCGQNYSGYTQAMNDLETLLKENKAPAYYFNLSMPRALPETRFNTIWRGGDGPELHGIGYFYLRANPDAADANYIKTNYAKPNPSQFLLEYGYVANKAAELGEKELTEWEREFYKYFKADFLYKQPYAAYIADYKKPYEATADIFSHLLEMQKKGLLDEITVSCDDMQLPDSINYFYGKGAKWVQTEKGTPVKYSFPRKMLSVDNNSIYKQFDRAYGSRERSYAMTGMGKKINFIFGTDEVPQLIYARTLSNRENLSADLDIITNSADRNAGKFDVTGIRSQLDCVKNFVSAGSKKTAKRFRLYLYNYGASGISADSMLIKMKNDYKKGNNIGLIELYTPGKSNKMFAAIASGSNAYPGINELSSYSSWNTTGNAIGLGIAHSQVYAVSEQVHHNPSVIVNAQIKMLAQHLYEDGIYTARGKLAVVNEGYRPTADEKVKSEKLYSVLNDGTLNFKDKIYRTGNAEYKIKDVEMTAYGFPWARTFDCYLDFDVKTEKLN